MGKGTIKTKAMTMAVAMSMVAGLCPSTVFAANSEDVAKVQDGTYTGKAKCSPNRKNQFDEYELSLKVTIENGKIVSIDNVNGNGDADNDDYISDAVNGYDEYESVVKQIVDAVQDDNFLVVYHNCGNTAVKTIDTIVTNGCLMYHFGNAINMAEMMSHVPENLIAMGNVDPAGEFRNGTAESVYNRTKEVMNECCKYKNFVISSGCDIPPMSPWENINAFFQAVEDFYTK